MKGILNFDFEIGWFIRTKDNSDLKNHKDILTNIKLFKICLDDVNFIENFKKEELLNKEVDFETFNEKMNSNDFFNGYFFVTYAKLNLENFK